MDAGLPKRERICGKSTIGKLLAEGRYGYASALKYCWLEIGRASCRERVCSWV